MTDNNTDEPTVACPICGDYEGAVSSVKSHITGSSGKHEGNSGGQYDELLRRRAGLLDEDDTDDEPDDDDTDESDEQADESAETDENDDTDDTEDDVATPEEYQAQQERLSSADEDDTDDEPATTQPVQTSGGGLGGLVDNIPTMYLVVGLLMALVVAYLMLSGDDSEDDVVDVEGQEPDETEDDDTVETGVMMG